jgi:hypothetical protein
VVASGFVDPDTRRAVAHHQILTEPARGDSVAIEMHVNPRRPGFRSGGRIVRLRGEHSMERAALERENELAHI